MQTERDTEIVDWIGRLGAAGAKHLMERFAMGRGWAYARLAALVHSSLLEQGTLLYRQPGLYIATAEGLRWRGLDSASTASARVASATRPSWLRSQSRCTGHSRAGSRSASARSERRRPSAAS